MIATPYTLRPYQQEAVTRGAAYLRDPRMRGRNGLIVAPTGSGKSLVIAGIAAVLDRPCVVFQPSKEILEQNAAKLAAYGYAPSIFSASFGRREIGSVTLATIGSVVRQAAAFRDVPYVLIDECHGVNAKVGMYRSFLEAMTQERDDWRVAFESANEAIGKLDASHAQALREAFDIGRETQWMWIDGKWTWFRDGTLYTSAEDSFAAFLAARSTPQGATR